MNSYVVVQAAIIDSLNNVIKKKWNHYLSKITVPPEGFSKGNSYKRLLIHAQVIHNQPLRESGGGIGIARPVTTYR